MANYSTPPIVPYLYVENVESALEWLAKAFGLRERLRQPGPEGKIFHAEMALGDDGVIMLGCPGPQYQNPKRLGHVTMSLYVRVADLDKHFEQAVNAGAVVLEQPTDQPYGDRRYGVEDPEGHQWYFAQSIT
jgi:PhnB protein